MSFYDERMWCKRCRAYVNYLQSTEASYCVNCGGKVQFFREEDLKRIRRLVGVRRRKRSRAS